MRKITYCVIDDEPLPLLFTLGAEMQIAERMGSMDALFDFFKGEESAEERAIREEIEKGMTAEQIAKRDAAQQPNGGSLLEVLPFSIAMLARQGQMYLGEKATFTEEWLTLHARPADIEPMTLALCKAIGMGLDTRHHTDNDEVDLVAEAIEKN